MKDLKLHRGKAPGQTCLISLTTPMKFTPYALCSSIPVTSVKMLASKIISHGSKSSFSTRRDHRRVYKNADFFTLTYGDLVHRARDNGSSSASVG